MEVNQWIKSKNKTKKLIKRWFVISILGFKLKDPKSKTTAANDSKLSSYDKQLLEDMRGKSPDKSRLTTIDEGF